MKRAIAAVALAAGSSAVLAAPTTDEMWQIIQEQQREIERLRTDQQQTDARVEATADAVERGGASGGKLAEWASRTTIGGYGEHHFNHFKDGDDQVDAHRFVLFVGHQFTDTVRFFSELEVEHGFIEDESECEFDVPPSGFTGGEEVECEGESSPGEVELEQAFIEWDYVPNHSLKMGQFLIPVGILNETHEPDTFYGVERNPVESAIIPATWWETGVMAGGEILPGLRYDVGVHSGFEMDDAGTVRGGRQKSAKANAEDLAVTARLKYTGIRGLELAATLQQQQDVTQGDGVGENEGTLWEAHARYTIGGLTLTALAAEWNIDGESFENGIGGSPADIAETAGRDEQSGWYGEASYRITPKLGVFLRRSQWDNNAGESALSGDTEIEQTKAGLNYWLVPNVVLKADITEQDSEIADADSINFGIGWSF